MAQSVSALPPQHRELAFPGSGFLYSYTGFTLQYNEYFEQADWVAWELTKEEALGNVKRRDNFRPDPNIKTGSADPADYKGSGYDRGHLAPAGDMKWSKEAMSESFYMSNISPQEAQFNRKVWKDLEELARQWAIDNGKILVTTGPIITEGYKTIGENNVAVPSYFFKVIADAEEPDIKGIGFIIPNKKSTAALQAFAYPIDYIEKITGFDFFYQLDEDAESIIEGEIDISKWSWDY
jgi:endonuclease G